MRVNRLRELVKAGKPTLGTRLITPWPRLVEVIGATGVFDYIEYASAYSNWDLELLENLARASDATGLSMTVKIEVDERQMLPSRAVGAGFHAVKFADIATGQDVKDCLPLIRAATPEAGGTVAWNHQRLEVLVGNDVKKYMDAVNDVLFFVLIESKEGLDNIDEILSVPGIDMLSFGRGDYRRSLPAGYTGPHADPAEAERYIAKKALDKGVPFRVHLHHSVDEAGPWLELGVRNFFIQTDIQSITEASVRAGGGVRKLLESL